MHRAIIIENLRKNLEDREILKGISFSVNTGDIFGYLGPNGAGKTTTIRILLGLFKADSGNVKVLGSDIEISETRKKIGFVLDLDGLYDNMTAEENLEFYSQIYGLSKNGKIIEKLLSDMGLKSRAKDKVGSYSKGMRQRLALARAMVHDPEVFILDEPTTGVDPSGQIEIRRIILDIVKDKNKTVFLSSHNLDEVQRICNRIALIDRGEIKVYGELEELRRQMSGSKAIIETTGSIPVSLHEEITKMPQFGFEKMDDGTLIFSPREGTEVPDIVSFLAGQGVKIEKVVKKETTLEEIYSTILKEVES